MESERVYNLEEQEAGEWLEVLERWGTIKERDDVMAGKQDFFYRMT